MDWSSALLLLLPLLVVVPANLAERFEGARVITYAALAAACAALFLLGLADMATGLLTAKPSPTAHEVFVGGIGLAVTGLVAAATIPRPVRGVLARALPLDPGSMVHVTALVLSLLLVGFQVTVQLTSDVLAQVAGGAQLTGIDLVLQELPFLVLALAGVGLFMRRDLGASVKRLGLTVPHWWQVVLALAAAAAFFGISYGLDWLGQVLTPETAQKVNAANQRIFGGLGDLRGIVTLAFAAGICEETLFRGALQPRLGIIWTAVVFASVHTQYGISFDVLAVFVLAIGLGLIRRLTNTTTSMLCHVAYNGVVGLVGAGIYLGIGVEAAAGLGLAAGLFGARRLAVSSQPR